MALVSAYNGGLEWVSRNGLLKQNSDGKRLLWKTAYCGGGALESGNDQREQPGPEWGRAGHRVCSRSWGMVANWMYV